MSTMANLLARKSQLLALLQDESQLAEIETALNLLDAEDEGEDQSH